MTSKFRKIKGWQDTDLVIIDCALPRIRKLQKETKFYPDGFQNIQEWKQCLTDIVLELERYKEYRQSICLTKFFMWFNHLCL